MNLLTAALSQQQELLWTLAALAAIALAFRAWRPSERRTMHVSLAFVMVAVIALAAAAFAEGHDNFTRTAVGLAVVLTGLVVVQIGVLLVFRGVMPMVGMHPPRIAHDLISTGLSLGWVFVWLGLLGVQPAQLFATSAVVTAVIAFSMQETLGNVLGGIVVQLDNSVHIGDWVRMDDVNGRVTDVRWRYTTIETRNRELVIVPNSWMMKNRFYVVRPPADGGEVAWRRGVTLQVSMEAEPSAVIETLERAVFDADIPHVLLHPAPSAILSEVGPGFCRYTLRYWLSNPQFDDPADSAVRVHALAALARGAFRLGIPQEERLTIREDERWRAAAEERENARRLEAIRRTEIFEGLPLAEQQALAEHLAHAPFASGDVMTRQGAVAHWLYLIVRGSARVHVDTPQGRVELGTLEAGSVFGEMGMLTGEPRSATVVAATAVNCYRLDKVGFAGVLQARPEIAKEISAIVEARVAQRTALLAKAGSAAAPRGDTLQRILSFFALRS